MMVVLGSWWDTLMMWLLFSHENCVIIVGHDMFSIGIHISNITFSYVVTPFLIYISLSHWSEVLSLYRRPEVLEKSML